VTSTGIQDPDKLKPPAEVVESAKRGKLAFFVGNGISRLYGFPSWETLCSRMLNTLAAKNKLDHNKVDLLHRQSLKAKISIADHYFRAARETDPESFSYKSMLEGSLKNNYFDESNAYASLAKCGVKFITTNYDNLLASSLEKKHGIDKAIRNSTVDTVASENTILGKSIESVGIHIDPYKFSAPEMLPNNVVFHLHGSYENESTVVASTASYLKLYGDENVQRFLRRFFETHVIVFLGYSATEATYWITSEASLNPRKRIDCKIALLNSAWSHMS